VATTSRWTVILMVALIAVTAALDYTIVKHIDAELRHE
jgi:hypothetical protein